MVTKEASTFMLAGKVTCSNNIMTGELGKMPTT